jgi:multidrug efflux pump subunit AcrB
VVVDLPEGATLEETARASRELADYLGTVPEVTDVELYVGTASPYNFNGLVRHYFLRRGANVADLQVNLLPKGARRAQSHDVAKRTPLVIMAPIPLTLVGILPAHALLGAFFTATSMIGFIAGAGIIVRNSIILVDFVELRRAQGAPLAEAVVDAGAIRFRPMLLTAAAVVVGAAVILFDPIFQGLAISLMAGEVASTLLSRMAVPLLYYESERRGDRAAGAPAASVP